MSDETIAVEREALFDLLAHLVVASRHLGGLDARSTAALSSVDHVGRELARILGVPAGNFGSEPPKPIRRGVQPRARVIVMPASRPVEELAEAVLAMCPKTPAPPAVLADGHPFGFRPLPDFDDLYPIDEDAFAEGRDPTVITDATLQYEDPIVTSAPRE